MNLKEIFLNESMSFEQWYERYRDQDNFLMNVCWGNYEFHANCMKSDLEEEYEKYGLEIELDYQDPENISYTFHKQELENFQKIFEDSHEEAIKESAREWFEDRESEIEYYFSSKMEITSNHITIYRRLTVKDYEESKKHLSQGKPVAGYKGLGVFWAWDKDKSEAHWGHGAGQELLLVGRASLKDINWKETFAKNFCPSLGEDEAEIYLEEGSPIELISFFNEETGEEVITQVKMAA